MRPLLTLIFALSLTLAHGQEVVPPILHTAGSLSKVAPSAAGPHKGPAINAAGTAWEMRDLRGPTLLVAASDAPARVIAQADYVCDGTDDDVQIQAAIAALSGGVGEVQLSEGTFTNSAGLTLPTSNIAIVGRGMGATIINFTPTSGSAIGSSSTATTRQNIRLADFKVSCTGGAGNTAVGINFTSIGNSSITNCHIHNCGTGLLVDATDASAYYNEFYKVYFQAGSASSGYVAVKLLESANAQHFFGCRFLRNDVHVQIGTGSLTELPNELNFFGCTFELADTAAIDILRGSSIFISAGRFELNGIGIRTAADNLCRAVVVDAPYFATNTTDISDSAAAIIVRHGGYSDYTGYGGGISSSASARNLVPNALMEGWRGTTDLLGWSSLNATDWDTTGLETQEGTIKDGGTYSCKAGNGTNASRGIATTDQIPVDATKPYTLRFRWATNDTATGMRHGYRCYDSAGAVITTGSIIGNNIGSTTLSTAGMNYSASFNAHILGSNQLPSAGDTFQTRGHVLRFPAGTVAVRLGFWVSGGSGFYVYIDNVYFAEGMVPTLPEPKPLGDSGVQKLHGDLTIGGNLTVNGSGHDGFTAIVKSANQDVTNAGLTNDTEFTFPVVTGGVYMVHADLVISGSNATGDFTMDLSMSTGTQKGKGTCQNLTSADAVQNIIVTAAAAQNTTAIVTGTAADVDLPIAIRMQYAFTASTNATYTFRFGNSAAASGRISRVWKGSTFKYKKLN